MLIDVLNGSILRVILLSVIVLRVIMLSVIMLSVVWSVIVLNDAQKVTIPRVIMLSVIMQRVVMLSVVLRVRHKDEINTLKVVTNISEKQADCFLPCKFFQPSLLL